MDDNPFNFRKNNLRIDKKMVYPNPQDHHVDETKDANEALYTSSHILPFEIEEGRGRGKAEPTVAGTPTKPTKNFCQRNWGKLLCLGIFAVLAIVIGCLIPYLWFHMPTAELNDQSRLRIDGLQGAQMDVKVKISNRNHYAISFENLFIDMYNMDNVHIGQITRPGRFKVKARSSGIMAAQATLRASLIDFAAMGINCLANDNLTKIKVKGSSDGLLFGHKIKQEIGPFDQQIQCIASNVGGANNPLGGANGNNPGIGNGQIINEIGNAINQGINNVFGGGRNRGGGGNNANRLNTPGRAGGN